MLYNQLESITEERIRSEVEKYLQENKDRGAVIAGTGSEDVIVSIVYDIILSIAEEEKENFKKIQKQGIEAARANGTTLGRPKTPLPAGFEKIYTAYQSGSITARESARVLEVPLSTFSYMVKKYRNQNT